MCRFAAIAAVVFIASCGAGSGTERELPAGPPTSAAPSDNVLFVSFAQSNLVAAFRLGTDGFLPSKPFSTMSVDSPRTIVVHDDILFVGSTDRISSATIAADGSLPAQPTAVNTPIDDGDISAMLVVDDVLFAAYTETELLISYRLEGGHIPPNILSTSGESFSNYLSMDEFDGYIYVHAPGLGRIDTFRILGDGSIDDFPEPQLPEVDLFGCEALKIHDGIIYAASSIRDRINSYTIDAVGLPEGLDDGEDPISHTRAEERYVDLAINDDILYAAAYNKGRVDAYQIDPVDGTLLEQAPISITEYDTGLYPTSVVLLDGFLYVSQAGRDRIDGFTVNADGRLSGFPATSTDPIEPGFPNKIIHGVYPP